MALAKENTTIGFIGIGVMGKSMAANLMRDGYCVAVYNRTKAKAEELIQAGAHWYETIADLAENCNVIITMVGYPRDVEEVYFGEKGIIARAMKGTYLIDMTTSCPVLAKRIYHEAGLKGLYALDAPVSGGDVGAREASLVIMAGGEEDTFAAVKPVFESLGKNIVLLGPAGAGQYTKMCNQILIAATMMGLCESLGYAQKAGLDPAQVINTIETGAAGSWSLSNLGPRIVAGNFAPGFYVKHFIKDMSIALESAKAMGLQTPALELAKSLYEKLAAMGEENSGTQALFTLYE